MTKRIILLFLTLSFSNLFSQIDQNSQSRKSDFLTAGFSVTIGGAFIANGTFVALPGERVDQFVTRVYSSYEAERLKNLKSQENVFDEQMKPYEYAKRNILLKRYNGDTVSIDLEKFRLTGDFSLNPYLKNDDLLIFPEYDLEKDFVAVIGLLNKPYLFQYVLGDRLSDALLFAYRGNRKGGFQNVYISRLSGDGQKEEVINVMAGENPLLQKGDRIIVRNDESVKTNYMVYVSGEVNTPGYIEVTKSNTTLREAIRKAGGFKKSADLNRAELIRGANVFRNLVFSEEYENLMMNRMANIEPGDSVSFMVDNKLRFFRGSGVIDFAKVEQENSIESKFIVHDGDVIYIPEKIELVYIYGQVNNPGYIEYIKGKDYTYYIAKAGGISNETAKKNFYLIKSKSRNWIKIENDKELNIEPGDYIWIPKETPRNFNYYLQRVGAIASVIGTIATLAVLIVQVSK